MSLSPLEERIVDTVLASRQVRWCLSVFQQVGDREVHLHTTHRMDRPDLVRETFALEKQRTGTSRVVITEYVTETLRWPVPHAELHVGHSPALRADHAESGEYFQVPAYGRLRLESVTEVRALLTEMDERSGQGEPGIPDPATALILRCVTTTQRRETALGDLPAG
ncbi:hypothetical protein ACH41H_24570 [Streptomyces sp. NPDC020800]|uniref:hypothetical protein n=1 Tax=Streptomyces sp. NPDC020800 TaxID=3365092 RepID=UPI00379F41D4